MKRLEKSHLELIRRTMDAESAQLIYSVNVSVREFAIAVGPNSSHFIVESPYKYFEQHRSNLPRRKRWADVEIHESVEFGGVGSASVLRLVCRKHSDGNDIENFTNTLIAEHCKLHAILDENYETELQECKLSNLEKEVLFLSAQGLTAKEIAVKMGKKDRAIEYLFKKAKDKLGVVSVQEATFRASHLLRM